MTPSLTLQTLVTPFTRDQCRATMVKTLVQLGVRADLWLPGGVASSILTVMAQVAALCSSAVANFVSGFFLPLSTGQMLQVLAQYIYGLDPTTFVATFATGNVTLTNTGGGVYSQAAGTYLIFNPQNGNTYANTAAFNIGAGQTISVPVQCVNQAGSLGNSNAGTVTSQQTNLLGVIVTNPVAIVGVDALSDSQIQQLCLAALGARSARGVRTAYQYAVSTALNAVTGKPVNVNRSTVSEASHSGVVTVYVASPAGPVDPNDIQGIINNIELIARPNAVTAKVFGASVINDSDNLTFYCVAPMGVSAAQIQAAIQNGLTTFFENYPVGGIVATDSQANQISGLFPEGVYAAAGGAVASLGATIISGQGANLYSLPPQGVPGNAVTVNIRLVSPPVGTFIAN